MQLRGKIALAILSVSVFSSSLLADAKLEALMSEKKISEAVNYAESSLPAAKRTAEEFVLVAEAYSKSDAQNKAFATFMLMTRVHPKDSRGFIGVARVYFGQKKYPQALAFGKKAFAAEQSADAAWEFARAALELNKVADAKEALATVIANDPTNVRANSALAQIYYDNKEYDKAVSLLVKAYTAKESPILALQIARSNNALKKDAEALKFYGVYITKGGKESQAIFEYAEILHKNGKFAEASKFYLKADGKVKYSGDVFFKWAESIEKSSSADKALVIYRKANKTYNGDKGEKAVSVALIVANADKKSNSTAAEQGYKFYLSVDSKSKKASVVYISLANVQVTLKKQAEAITSLEKAIVIDANSVDAYATLADLYAKAGQKEKSEKTLEELIKRNGSDPTVFLKLADFKFANKVYDVAITNYKKSDSLKATYDAKRGIALSYISLKNWTEVVKAAKPVLAEKVDTDVQRGYAEALFVTGDFASSIPELKKVLLLEPRNLKFWRFALEAGEAQSNLTITALSDSAITALDPKDVTSRERYAVVTRKSGLRKEALKGYSELVKLKPANSSFLISKYELEVELELNDAAIVSLRKYLKAKPTDLNYTMKMGELQFAKGLNDSALTYYRKALKINPQPEGFPYTNYAKVVIAKGLTNEVIKALGGLIETGKAVATTYTTLGMIYMEKKNFIKATEMYEEALLLDPANIDALIALGDCQFASNDAMMASVTYEQVVMMKADAVDVYRKLGLAYEKSGDTESAFNNYITYLKKDGDDSVIAKKVGDKAFSKKDYKVASTAYLRVSGAAAKDFNYQMNLATSLYQSKRYKDAIVWQQKVMSRNPKAATKKNILKELAISFEMIGDTANAIKTYDTFKTLKLVDKDVFYQRAKLRQKSDLPLSVKIYEGNIKAFPKDMRNQLALGLIYSRSDNEELLKRSAKLLEEVQKSAGSSDPKLLLTIAKAYGKAYETEKELATYNQYIVLIPDDVDAYVRVGEITSMMGNYTVAIENLEIASTLKANDTQIQLLLADAYLGTQSYSQAISILGKLQISDPKNTDVLKLLITANKKSGNRDAAKQMLEKLVAQENDRDYNLMYVDFLIEDKNYKEAMKFVESALEIYADDLDALLLQAIILRAEGDNNNAVLILKDVVMMDPYNGEALYQLAKTYKMIGGAKMRMAISYYKKAVTQDPTLGKAWYEKAMLHKIYKQVDEYKKSIAKAAELMPKNPEVIKEAKLAGI
jgi:tetratricopeptide (TPR) repeat protein